MLDLPFFFFTFVMCFVSSPCFLSQLNTIFVASKLRHSKRLFTITIYYLLFTIYFYYYYLYFLLFYTFYYYFYFYYLLFTIYYYYLLFTITIFTITIVKDYARYQMNHLRDVYGGGSRSKFWKIPFLCIFIKIYSFFR